MKVKIISALGGARLEQKINWFLQQNEGKIELIDIKWTYCLDHAAMIIYKEK